MPYDASGVRAYFDVYAGQEWARLEETVQGRTSYAVHRRVLERSARAGMRVLDIGAGPGRYAIDLARLGCAVTVADLSPVQLDLARQHLEEAGLLPRVAAFRELDVTELGELEPDSFDLVVAFGGVLSYTCELYPKALRELVRVARPGAPVLVSVMSLHGTLRLAGPLDAAAVLARLDDHLDLPAALAGDDVVFTRPGSPEFHQPMALFTSEGLRAALSGAGLAVEAIASANPLLPYFQNVPRIAEQTEAETALRQLELAACECPGLRDAGGHIIAAARRPVLP